jgi:hypothetical protein
MRSGAAGVPRAAALAGLAGAFVVVVDAVRLVRPGLLVDPEPSWAVYRLALGLAVGAATSCAGVLAAGLLFACARSPVFASRPARLPLGPATLALLILAAFGAGVALRFLNLARLPEWLWIDDVSLISPTLALAGKPSDFADAVRPVPFGVAKLYGTVGVLYLEGFRLSLRLWGSTVFGLRFPSALAGVVSLATAGLLGRALLPRGGGALTLIALAGLRWHLILSRWGWNMIALAPVVDVATLLVLRARRRGGAAPTAAGAVAGLGAHVYLSAWVAGAALLGYCVAPGARDDAPRTRLKRALLYAGGFLVAVAPLLLFREGRPVGYFARAGDHNVVRELLYRKSSEPLFAALADGLVAPWLADPTPRVDLPGRRRLGWILGVPVLVAFVRSLLSPREELSSLLLLQAGAALAASVAAGQAGHPNGARFGYLTSLTAVAVAAGVQLLLAGIDVGRRRAAAFAATGLLAISGALAARDALVVWPERPETFESFHGGDTLVARAALRWESVADVDVARGIGHSDVTIDAIRRYRLDPDARPRVAGPRSLAVRIVAPGAQAGPGERLAERVTAPGGGSVALVFARRRT